MPGNQMTNVQRGLFLNALRDAWPHVLKNPSDLTSTIQDISNRLNLKIIVSRKTVLGYARDLGLPRLPNTRSPAQQAAIAKARSSIKSTPPTPAPDYTTLAVMDLSQIERRVAALLSGEPFFLNAFLHGHDRSLTQLNDNLSNISHHLTNIDSALRDHTDSLFPLLERIAKALEPTRKE